MTDNLPEADYISHSMNGLCPECGCELDEHSLMVYSGEDGELEEFVQLCPCCEWESVPYYE